MNVEHYNDEKVTEALNKIYAEDAELSKLGPAFEQLQHALLGQEKW